MKHNRDFDIKVTMEVKVMPREVPDTVGKFVWDAIESKVDWEARLLANSLEGYFERMAYEEVSIRFEELDGCDCKCHGICHGMCLHHCFRCPIK